MDDRHVTIEQMLREAKKKLAQTSSSGSLDAELLLSFVLKKPRSYLWRESQQFISPRQRDLYSKIILRRANQEPIAYLTGTREFWSLPLSVTSDTLIPRPETELLIETARNILSADHHSIADLGTGCGAIACALAHENRDWDIHAIDKSKKALAIAKKNAEQLQIKNIAFHVGDWLRGFHIKNFDLILANPPYLSEEEWEMFQSDLRFEPKQALVSGPDGLKDIREIVAMAKAYLKNGGYLLLEHGYRQAEAVRKILSDSSYQEIITLRDLSGQERVTLGRCFC